MRRSTKLKESDTMTDTYKIILLEEWNTIRSNVRKGLKRLGHDIILVPLDRPSEKKGKKNG